MRTLNGGLHVVRWDGLGRFAGIVASVSGALATALAGFMVALVLLPSALVLPVVAISLLLAAVTLAILAWAAPGEVGGARLVFWDTAGALTLIGLCVLSGEAEAVALIECDR
jgi:hypothetical protein